MATRKKHEQKAGTGDSRPRLSAWRSERAAFDRLAPELRRRYRGRWVAIHGGLVVGSARDGEKLIERMAGKFGGEVFFVGYVGGKSPAISMPGFEVECVGR